MRPCFLQHAPVSPLTSVQVDLSQLYSGVPGGARYRLRALACYYGRHYSAFVRLPELHDRWVM